MRPLTKIDGSEVISSLFILLFAYTACSKLMELDRFYLVLSESPLISNYADVLYWIVPLTELVAAFMLLFPKSRKMGLLLSLVLMVLFTVYVAGMLGFSPTLPCSCGGVISGLGWTEHLYLNIGLTAIAFAGYRMERRKAVSRTGLST